MSPAFFYAFGMSAAMFPFLSIAAILLHHRLRLAARRRNRLQNGKDRGFWPTASALGTAFQFLHVIYQPSTAYVLEAKQEERADEDDSGDPEAPTKQLNRQLRKIRRGEPIDTIVLRLDGWKRESPPCIQ
jgi:hypothetical protein